MTDNLSTGAGSVGTLQTLMNSHAINLVTGKPQDGAFALYTAVPTDKAAILPDSIPFTQGVVAPLLWKLRSAYSR